MTSERARRLREAVEAAEQETIRSIEEEGALRHLHGRPLDLSDDTPGWFFHRALKEEGFSHPLIERSKDVEQLEREVGSIVEGLRRSRARLTRSGYEPTREQIEGFNTRRDIVLGEYRTALTELNRAITFHNLGVPEALHRKLYLVDEAVARIAREIPPIEIPEAPGQQTSTLRTRLLRALRRHSPSPQ